MRNAYLRRAAKDGNAPFSVWPGHVAMLSCSVLPHSKNPIIPCSAPVRACGVVPRIMMSRSSPSRAHWWIGPPH